MALSIPVNPIPSGLPTKHNYLRKVTAIPTDFNPLDIVLNTTSLSIDSSLGQKYIYTYTIDSVTVNNITDYILIDNNSNAVIDYIDELTTAITDIYDNIITNVYNGDQNNINSVRDFDISYLAKQKTIYFLDSNNQIIFSKILDDGIIKLHSNPSSKTLELYVHFNSYSNVKSGDDSVRIDLITDEMYNELELNINGATWFIDAPSDILENTSKVVLYTVPKGLKFASSIPTDR